MERTLILDTIAEGGHLISRRRKISKHLARFIAELRIARERTGLNRAAGNDAPVEFHCAVVSRPQTERESPKRTRARSHVDQSRLGARRIVGPIQRRKDEGRRDGVVIPEAQANRRPPRPSGNIDICRDGIAPRIQFHHPRRDARTALKVFQVQEYPHRQAGRITGR